MPRSLEPKMDELEESIQGLLKLVSTDEGDGDGSFGGRIVVRRPPNGITSVADFLLMESALEAAAGAVRIAESNLKAVSAAAAQIRPKAVA